MRRGHDAGYSLRPFPVPFIVANLFAPGADRDQALNVLTFFQRGLEFMG